MPLRIKRPQRLWTFYKISNRTNTYIGHAIRQLQSHFHTYWTFQHPSVIYNCCHRYAHTSCSLRHISPVTGLISQQRLPNPHQQEISSCFQFFWPYPWGLLQHYWRSLGHSNATTDFSSTSPPPPVPT